MSLKIFQIPLTYLLLTSGTEFGLHYKEENMKIQVKAVYIGDGVDGV